MNERMYDAYRAAKTIIDERTSPEDRDLLRRVSKADVLVVRGCYDRVEDVLAVMEIPFEIVDAKSLNSINLREEQMLIINCPGELHRKGLTRVREFVASGGSLFTTDWALRHVIEPAFPGLIAYNERPTSDDVVRIEIRDNDSAFLKGVFEEGADPLWWLEGSSYPIKILDKENVNVLLTSRELEKKYGEAPVAVNFNFGEGEVFHMISHYYLQRAETRTERHQTNWKDYAMEVGSATVATAPMPEFDTLTTGEVEAAHKSAAFMRNLIVDKQRKIRQM